MDRAYKEDIPKYRAALEALKDEFSSMDASTDWVSLRIEPLLEHARRLEGILKSPKFAREIARLRTGVAMFHADLVYLRANLSALKAIRPDGARRRKARGSGGLP